MDVRGWEQAIKVGASQQGGDQGGGKPRPYIYTASCWRAVPVNWLL
jgi:hypothetical protein